MPFSFGARCGGDFRFAPCVAGTCGSPTHAPSLFCDTIQFAIETDRSCHRQGPGAGLCSGLFSLPQICAPVPADLSLPGSKKAPGRVSSFGLYHRLPQDSPSRIHAAERHTKALHSSLFSLHSPHSGLPLPLPGKAREPPSAGGRRISSPAAMRNCKTPFPPHSPACRAQAHSESMPQSGTPQLFTLLYSLFPRPAPAFPSRFPGAPASCSQQGRRISSPAAMRDCKTPFPRTAPPAGHRLVLNLCRRAALRNYSLFTILYSLSQPCPLFPPGRTAKQKYILFFFT